MARKTLDFSKLTPDISRKDYNAFRDAMRKRYERAGEWLPGKLKDTGTKMYQENSLPTWNDLQGLNNRERKTVFRHYEKYMNSPLSSKTAYKAYRTQTEETLMKRKSVKNKADITNQDVKELQELLGTTNEKHLDSDQIIEIFTNSMRKEEKNAEEARADIEKLIDSFSTQEEVETAISKREMSLRRKHLKKASNEAKTSDTKKGKKK